MLSSKDTPVHEVHRKSRDYIECNLKESWLLMQVAETDSKRPVALIERCCVLLDRFVFDS